MRLQPRLRVCAPDPTGGALCAPQTPWRNLSGLRHGSGEGRREGERKGGKAREGMKAEGKGGRGKGGVVLAPPCKYSCSVGAYGRLVIRTGHQLLTCAEIVWIYDKKW